jgi:hypothetical protein
MTPEDTDLLDANRRKGFWRIAHHQAWNDVKNRWRRGLFWVMCIFVFSGLLSLLLLVATYNDGASWIWDTSLVCHPDGTFSLHSKGYNYWAASGFFQITLPYGNLTFTQAKVIDVVWDVVCSFNFPVSRNLVS